MQCFDFSIDVPPSDNALYFNRRKFSGKQKGRGLTSAARTWKTSTAYILRSQGVKLSFTGQYFGIFSILSVNQKGQRKDLSNCYKAFIDVVSDLIQIDDKFLVEDIRLLNLGVDLTPNLFGTIAVWDSYSEALLNSLIQTKSSAMIRR